ncbi:hypothetical protein [Salidesulfovibrio brasiliensis]|uniref:hypothetical protein n=1 Tax=Salidesulfovibrio brasiliensis TaxID=221711 RepID=UPI0006D23B0F|nr:hypothetical protein [Salidesulfovibrio brasiliensis]
MKKLAITLTLLGILLASLSGCKTMGKNVHPTFQTKHIGTEDTLEPTAPGESVLFISQGVYSKELHLKNFCEGDGTGNSLDFPPGRYGNCANCVEEDENNWYFYYPELQSLGGLGWGAQVRAGFRINKKDYTDYQALTPSDVGYAGFDLTPAPKYEVVDMLTYEAPYHYKYIEFESFEDDILTLKYGEEEGPTKGLGTEEETLTLQFDLLESKTLKIKEAELEVVEAGPDKLVVKIIKGLVL